MTQIKLKVMEALQDDAYKGIARIDSETMKSLGVNRGDVVIIKGKRDTVAIIDRAYPADVGESIIRIDGIIRHNAKTSIGEIVFVTKAEVKEAKKVMIAPAQKGLQVHADSETFRRGLLGRAVLKGDIVVLGGAQRRRDLMDDFGLFEIFGEAFGGMGLPTFTSTRFMIVSTQPIHACIITESTEVTVNPKAVELLEEKIPDVTYEDIGGLDEEIRKIREMVELPLKHPELFTRLGIEPPKGVLLHGPPGTGKTLLAKAVANESGANFILLNGPECMSKFYGESEKKIRDIFEEAEKSAPAIIFIDEIDAIAPKREESYGEVERRVVSQILTMMDGLKSRGKVIVIGATNLPNLLDPALRRPGRFDREVVINVPSKQGRLSILKIHTRNMPIKPELKRDYVESKIKEIESKLNRDTLEKTKKQAASNLDDDKKLLAELTQLEKKLSDNEDKNHETLSENYKKYESIFLEGMLSELAAVTHGFVGADLASLCKEAAMNIIRKVLPDLGLKEDEEITQEVLQKLIVTKQDFYDALKSVRPSAMREVLVEKPNVKWNDVGGLEHVQQELKEAVDWPLKYPDSFKRVGIKPPRGILLYGPPGTGKTLLAKAVANESEANFIQIKGPSLLSMWVGESEKGVRKIFERARQVSPCIIFFDEIDSLASRRGYDSGTKATERVLNQMLAEMDGLEELRDVTVIGATNRPDMLDPALLRPGRFDRIISVGIPNKHGRFNILKIHTKNMPIGISNEELKELDKKFKQDKLESNIDTLKKMASDESIKQSDLEKSDKGKDNKINFKDLSLKDKLLYSLAEKMEGYTGADIESVVKEAGMLALRDDIKAKEVNKKHFDDAMKKVMPSVKQEDIKKYKEIEDTYLKSARAAIEKHPNHAEYLG
ncbi:MAG: CDC48 family AAA ATPase [archaeon]